MICVELAFSSDPERLAARPAHRQRLVELHARGMLLAAGPWDDDSGALLVFDADQADVATTMAGDPYFTTPGVEVRSVRSWQPVVGPQSSSS